jgi:hypothetical protein
MASSRAVDAGAGTKFWALTRRIWSNRDYPAWLDAAYYACLALLCGLVAWIGAVHTFAYGHDIFAVLDGAWRVLNGQRPHIDFSSGWGPVVSLVLAAGLRLAHFNVNGVGYAAALIGLIVGLWGYRVCRYRMAAVPAVIACLLLAMVAMAPFPVGTWPRELSHAMAYNRHGYALAGLVILEAFQTAPADRKREAFWGGLSSGAACALALMLKASYGLVTIGLVAASLVLFRPSAERLLGLCLGFACVLLAVLTYLGFHVSAMLADLRQVAAARSEGMSAWAVREGALRGLREFLPLALLASLAMVSPRDRTPETWVERARPALIAAVVFAAGVMLLASNAQNYGYPLSALVAILLATEAVSRLPAVEDETARSGWIGAFVALAVMCFLPQMASDAFGIAYGAMQARSRPSADEVPRFAAAHLAPLLLFDVNDPRPWEERSNGRMYVEYLNDGMALLEKYSSPTETVRTFDAHDPFSYALLRRPAEGGPLAMAYKNTFSDTHKPSAEQFFGSADVVMLPKYPSASDATFGALARNYGEALTESFRLCAESLRWQMFKRAGHLTGCPSALENAPKN